MRFDLWALGDALANAGLNGLCQGVLVVLAVSVAMRFLRRSNAATRHAVWLVTLLIVAGLIPAQLIRDSFAAKADAGTAAEITSSRSAGSAIAAWSPGANVASPDLDPAVNRPVDAPPTAGDRLIILGPAAANPPDGASISVGRQESELREPIVSADSGPRARLAADAGAEAGRRAPRTAPGWYEGIARVTRTLQPGSWVLLEPGAMSGRTVLVLLFFLGAVSAARVGVLLWRLADLRRLKRNALPATEPLVELFERLRSKMGVTRDVQLKVSLEHHSPVVLGFIHPVVLLPASAEAGDPAMVEPVLQHELAHVARRDDWANLGQNLIQAALFFHPAVWWVSRRLSLEREIACDDQVLRLGSRPRAYALLLADVASRLAGRRPLLAPAVSTNTNQLTKRIDMILNTRRDISPCLAKGRLGFITGAAALTAAFAFCAGPRLVLAQSTPAPAALAPAPVLAASAGAAAVTPAPVAVPAVGAGPIAATPLLVGPAGAGAIAPAAVITLGPTPTASYDTVQVTTPVPPTPEEVDNGPKDKPESPDQPVLPPVILAPRAPTPAPAPLPLIVAVPRAETYPAAPVAMTPPPPPGKERRLAEENRSLENRVRRLERMVDSLMSQDGPKHANQNFDFKGKTLDEPEMHAKAMAELDRAQRQVPQAAEESKRAAEKAELAAKAGREWKLQGKVWDGSGQQLEGLRRAREALGREMERLDRQIEKLEQERERLNQDREKMEQDKKLRGESPEKPADEQSSPETAEVEPR